MSDEATLDMLLEPLDREVLAREASELLDHVQAADSSADSWMDLHDHARDHAEVIYSGAFDRALWEGVRRLHKGLVGVRGDEAALAVLLLFDDELSRDMRVNLEAAGREAHDYVEGVLGEKRWGEPEARAREFAETRREPLAGVGAEVANRLKAAVDVATREGQSGTQILRRIDEAANKASLTIGQRVAATESQVCYGVVVYSALVAAGYDTKRWRSQRDGAVRESHRECDAQGAIGLTKVFMNGGRYPGDPNLPVSETANCRCYLMGVNKQQN